MTLQRVIWRGFGGITRPMTDPILRQAGTRPPRIIAGLVAAAALLHMSSASAQPEPFDAHFADFETLAEPVIPAEAVDLDSIVTDEAATEEADTDAIERELDGGMASYYGSELAGRRTASGERFDPRGFTAAHRTLPFGSKVRVTNPANGRSVVVRINDRGPFARGRVIDVSRSAAERIGLVARGHGQVELALLGS
jgi:rare lipoprotein A